MDEQKETSDQLINRLYEGYNVDSPEDFVRKIADNVYEVYKLTASCYALLKFHDTDVLEVLTCAGNIPESEQAMKAIERIARKRKAVEIVGYARYGWRPLLNTLGYLTGSKLVYFRKQL